MTDFEKLGVFYLGKEYDLRAQQPLNDLLLYESKDLCTHAVCVGMTGSGKTDVLQQLARAPHHQPVLDLEKLACHKGSSFGAIGQPPMPTQEQFENNLAAALLALPTDAPIWVEDESRQIGRLAGMVGRLLAGGCQGR